MNLLPKSMKLLLGLLVALLPAWAQFGPSGTTTVSVTVSAEAAIQVDTATTTLTAGSVFGDFTGTTNLTYKVRTTETTGDADIQLQVTADFSPGGGPSVASPPTVGDELSYTCSISSPATSCVGSQTSDTASATSVAAFGAGVNSDVAGNAGSVVWTLTNDPEYGTGTYTATVTFTISAT